MREYIYSISDMNKAIGEACKGLFGDDMAEIISERVEKEMEYVNWFRFQHRNCPGCVSGPEECDLVYGRGAGKNGWAKPVNGDIFDCPVRTNGTMTFSREEGMRSLDISDGTKPPYPVVSVERTELRD